MGSPERSGCRFWWARLDLYNYKAPAVEGKGMLPDDYLQPGYIPNLEAVKFSFAGGQRDPRKLGDFADPTGSAFFMNQRAIDALADILRRHCRSYPVLVRGKSYHFVLIDTVRDGFDLSRSEYELTDVPGRIEDHISRFFRVTLRHDFEVDDDIFRLEGSFALLSTVIVSDRFKKRCEASGLEGLLFRPTDGSGIAYRPPNVLGPTSPPISRH
jgi:hypothetical protein